MNNRKKNFGIKILKISILIIILAAAWGALNGVGILKELQQVHLVQSEYMNNNIEEAKKGNAKNTHKEKPKIALTFDDGPSISYTGRLLDGLKERDIKATFFLIGENAKENADLVKRIFEEGHVIGNHTYHHVDITKLEDEEAAQELNETDEVIYSITGEHVRYVRPPFGIWQKDLELKMEVLPVMWSVDPLDWTTENVDEIVNKVVTEIKEDDIILLHDCYGSSVDAALRIVDILTKEGYEFVTVDEMIIN